MIGNAVQLIRDELGRYVELNRHASDTITEADVVLDNIAMLESESSNLNDRIVITVANIEEESTLKNSAFVQRSGLSTSYVEPPVHVNLYLLISVTPALEAAQAYEMALHRLSSVIQFFQIKRKFTVQNSPNSSVATDVNLSEEERLEICAILELYTLTFEQLNHLWGALGGKQSPSVMYKVRLVKIQDRTKRNAPVIEEIQNNLGRK